jgi:transposase-like protein
MPRERRNFTAAEKMAILREHFVEKLPISQVCSKHGIQPTLFYLWQKKLFEEGGAVFERSPAKAPRQLAAEQRRIEALEAKIRTKDEVLAELMGEHVALKKSLGEI